MHGRLVIGNRRRGGLAGAAFRLAAFLAVVGTLAGAGAVLAVYVRLSRDLPVIPPFDAIRFGGVGTVRAAHGQVLAEVFEQRRYLVPSDRLPKTLVNAFLDSEDARFFEHAGLDLRGIARAVWTNLRAGEVKEGASTITQQLARSLLLSHERSVKRKVREAILARRIEDIYTKDQILVLYLNLIFLGEGAYGVQAASRVYYGKDLDDLTVGEAATIAALPQSPGRVNPASNPAEMKVRRDRVIRRMREAGHVTAEQEAAALAEEVRCVTSRDNLGDRAPVPATAVMKTIRGAATDAGGVDLAGGGEGLTAVSTVDLGLQRAAQDAVVEAAQAHDRRQGFRGPLATLPAASWPAFLERNRAWLARHGRAGDPAVGQAVLALVTEAGRTEARLQVTPEVSGTLPLAQMAWAVPYTEFPVKDPATGARQELPRVSLDGRLDAVDKALRAGDVILAVRVKPAPVPVRKPKKGRKGEPPPPPEPPPPAGPVFALSQFPRVQAALVALEPRSGYLQALVGGTDFDASQVDRTASLRQTGSLVKPVYYSKAYDIGIPPSALVAGAPFREGSWTPEGEKATDDLTLWEALTRSENNCSLRVYRMVLERAGLESLNDWAQRLGLTRPFQGFAAEALGVDATALDLARVYGTFALGGVRPDAGLVKWVRDGHGRLLVDRRSARDPSVPTLDAAVREVVASASARRAVTAEAAWLIADNLRNVAEEGTAKSTRKLGRPVAGKTGTLPYDVWFAGWTREVLAVAWVGEDVRERFLGRTKASGAVFGADTALPAWMGFVRAATAGRPAGDGPPPPPDGVEVVSIDPATGLLAREKGVPMPHLKGTAPEATSPAPGERPEGVEAAEF